MKRVVSSLVLVAVAVLALNAYAAGEMAMGKTVTLRGEVVDTGCYLGHGATGAKHKECATKCIANGMPMGLLTADGALYLITMSHSNADAYNQLKGWAAETVEVTGVVSTRNGLKGIEADAVKLLTAK
jgi:type 1 fimbria pilin